MINADVLRTLMEQKGVNARQLAEISTVPKSTIDRILNGTTPNPSLQTCTDISVALGVSIDILAGVTPQPTDAAPDAKMVVVTSQDEEIKTLLRERIEMQKAWLKRLFFANTVFLVYEVVRWLVDLTTPGVGFIRDSVEANTSLVLLLVVVFIGVAWLVGRLLYEIIARKD